MKDYFSFAHTSIGFFHVLSGKVCQDYSLKYQDENASVIVVSDGHGSVDFPRSDRGARFACEVALESVKEFLQDVNLPVLESSSLRDNVVRQLCKNILLRWNMRVEENVNSEPFSIAELEDVSARYRGRYFCGSEIEHAYGCTLIVFIITPYFCLALRNGDGQCVVVDREGKFTTPIPWNEKCESNITTSLCAPEAIENFRYYYSDKLPAAVFISSDGVDNSYTSMEELYNLYRSVCLKALQDREAAADYVERILPEITKRGSMDDVSIAGLLNTQLLEYGKTVMEIALEMHQLRLEDKHKEQQERIITKDIKVAMKKKTKLMERLDVVKKTHDMVDKGLKLDWQNLLVPTYNKEDCLAELTSLEEEYRMLTEKIRSENSEIQRLINKLRAMGAEITINNLKDTNQTFAIEVDDLS